jgi:hypothetical protein
MEPDMAQLARQHFGTRWDWSPQAAVEVPDRLAEGVAVVAAVVAVRTLDAAAVPVSRLGLLWQAMLCRRSRGRREIVAAQRT